MRDLFAFCVALLGLFLVLMCTDFNPLLMCESYRNFASDVFDTVTPFAPLFGGCCLVHLAQAFLDLKISSQRLLLA